MSKIRYDVTSVPDPSLRAPRTHPAARDEGLPEFPPEEMYGLAGDVVRALLPWTEADPAGLYFNFLAAVGNAIGPGPHAYAGPDRHVLKLWTVAVGATSAGRKGTAWSAVRNAMEAALPEWVHGTVKSGLSSGEGLIAAMAGMEEEPRALLAVETEFGKSLVVASRYGNTLSDQMRQLWDGDTVAILNKQAVHLEGAYFSLVGMITGQELTAKMADVDLANGFANRILWVCVRRSKLIPSGKPIPDELLVPIARRIRKSVRAARRLGEMKRSAAGAKRWEKLYLEMAAIDPPGLLGAVTERREAQCLRLSMVFAALDGRKRIGPEHVEAAWRAWQYSEQSAVAIFGSSSGDAKADKALGAMRRAAGRQLKRSEVRRVFSNNVNEAELDAIRDALVENDFIKVEKLATKGRPAELWELT